MKILLNALTKNTQEKLIEEVKKLISNSPLITPIMPKWGKNLTKH